MVRKKEHVKIETSPYSNDINISIYGNLNNPQIRGIGPANK